MSSVSILHCGWLAEQVFEQNTRIKSLGATSKAAYLLSPDGQVVILSFDRYHSPLTCTLRTFSPELRALTPGEVFEISPQALTHPTITLQRQGAKIWRESMPAGSLISPAERLKLLQQAAGWLADQKITAGFSVLFQPILQGQIPTQDAFEIYTHISRIINAIRNGTLEAAAPSIIHLLGFGLGLTPSGDDLLTGLLLIYNRWPALCPHDGNWVQAFNQLVLADCRQRTTALSASLLEQAALGCGDERLLAAVDGLASGQPGIDTWLPELKTYGSSSGVDALLGMAVAIRAQPDMQFPYGA